MAYLDAGKRGEIQVGSAVGALGSRNGEKCGMAAVFNSLFDTELEIYIISPSHYYHFLRNFVFQEEQWLIKNSMHAD